AAVASASSGASASSASSGASGAPPPHRGAMWRARRASDGTPVAVKLFPAEEASYARRESDLAHAVPHPNVLAPLDLVAGDDVVGLILPWADGGTLAGLIATRHRLRWRESLTVLIALADAVAAAHERDMVHGDISAGNA